MNTNVKFHNRIPLGMIEGNTFRVWVNNGSELTIQQSSKYGPHVRYRHSNALKFITIGRLYKEIFPESKKSIKVQTEFSKGDLKQQNRRGVYVPSANTRNNLISIAGYILSGLDKGKHLRSLSVEKITWYANNINLNYNERVEVDKELKNRGI